MYKNCIARTNKKQRRQNQRPKRIDNRLAISEHKYVRSTFTGATLSQVIGVDVYNGFTYNGVSTGGFNMEMAFTLGGTVFYFGGVSTFTAAMPNYTEFTSLYDQYRIDGVDVELIFSNDQSSVNSPATSLPLLYYAIDYDDANTVGVPDIVQYDNHKMFQLGSPSLPDGIKRIHIKPNVDMALYNGVSTGYARFPNARVDTGSPNVPHYGLKMAFDGFKSPGASTIVGYLNVVVRYHLTMFKTK